MISCNQKSKYQAEWEIYRATTISCYSTSSSPEKLNAISNRLGIPLSRGAEKPEGPSALPPITESGNLQLAHMSRNMNIM